MQLTAKKCTKKRDARAKLFCLVRLNCLFDFLVSRYPGARPPLLENFRPAFSPNPSSETQGQLSGSGEKAGRKFSSKGKRAPGYRLSPRYFQNSSGCRLLIGHKKCFVLLCPIGEQLLLSSFREFVHDGYCLTTLARLVHQACACKGNFYFLLS